jgi:hypothetical protein
MAEIAAPVIGAEAAMLRSVAEMAGTVLLFDTAASILAAKLAWPLTYLSNDYTQIVTL